jgi:hypothetical protein
MAGRPRYTADQVARALKATRGLVSLAAQHLGCDPDTVQGYCRRHATVEAAKRQARDSILDVAEARLFLAVDRGEAWAITFYFKTIGCIRGYGERLDVSLSLERAASVVATQLGISVDEVLTEARLLLREVDSAEQ